MSLYSSSLWTIFRESVIQADECKCTICGRSSDEVTLQVHHKRYIAGRKPWEYAMEDCRTLCKGCHASEHGIIRPKFGWEYIGEDDLGDLIGTCDNCGSSIRYVFYVFHEKWGTLEVGTHCCDMLTDSDVASNLVESKRRYEERKKRFLDSKRWKVENGIIKIKQGIFDIEIKKDNSIYYLKIYKHQSNFKYLNLDEAKSKAFDVIENGEFIDYLKRHNINIEEISKNKKRKNKTPKRIEF